MARRFDLKNLRLIIVSPTNILTTCTDTTGAMGKLELPHFGEDRMSFEVDGERLRARRLEQKEAPSESKEWSQEAVALRAGVDRKTVGDMERRKGQRFEIEIIRYVCSVLEIDPDDVILTPAREDIVFDGPRKIDFRPARPWNAPDWENSRIVIALDQMGIATNTGVTLAFELQGIRLRLPQVDKTEAFKCRYLSRLIPGVPNHLGIESEFEPQHISKNSPVQPRAWSFKSDGDYGLTWMKLNDALKGFSSNVLSILVEYKFDKFSVEKEYRVSLAQLHSYMNEIERTGQSILKFAQLEVLDL